MRRLCSVMIAVLLGAAGLAAETLDEILARNFEARGGLEKIKGVRTQRLTGRISFGPEAEGRLLVEIARGGKMRQQITIGGKTMMQVTDGNKGWSLTLPDAKEPKDLTAGEVRNMQGGADFDGPLVDYKSRGIQVELVGKDKVEGRDAWKLLVTMAGGEKRTDFIDCESYLETKWEGRVESGGRTYEVGSFFRDHRKVDGVVFAYRIDSYTVGSENKQVIVMDQVEVNVPLEETRFGRP